MNHHTWMRRWRSFFGGVGIGIALVTPAFAATFDALGMSDTDLYRLLALGAVVFIAALLIRYAIASRTPRSERLRPYGLRTTAIRSREP